MKRVLNNPFPPGAVLLSRAWWFACEHPVPILILGLLGSAPFAGLFLLFVCEAQETLFFEGTTAQVMKPLAFGLAAVYFLRFPFRLALARWMGRLMIGKPVSVPSSLGWAMLHLPTALFYGSVSTLGWMLGSVLLAPFMVTYQASLAFHRFAVGEQGAWAALSESSKIPLGGIGSRLLTICSVLFLVTFGIVWTTPQSALGLAQWLFKADVSAFRQVFSLQSLPWLTIATVFPLLGIEILWSISFGLLAAEWHKLTKGADLFVALENLEAKESAPLEDSK